MYLRGTCCNSCGLFHADEDMAFAVTHGSGWPDFEHLPYSEVDWLEPEVVRLLGSIMLAEDEDGSILRRFYPVPHAGFEIDEERLDLTNSTTAKLVKAALVDTIDRVEWPPYIRANWEACLGRSFDLIDPSASSKRLQRRYYAAFSHENHILMRGIQALIKSDMLARHLEFQEEATIAAFIALDASFEMVIRHLRQTGLKNPGSREAGDWLYKTFDEPLGLSAAQGLKYFEEFYEQRIQTIHPGSRFGDAPFAPVMTDDWVHLRIMLPQVFGYLLLQEHAPHFMRRVEEAKRLG
ncbi:hypothetical protein WS45_08430 [Burkholderia sp. RF2-non_BP3]|nr:hypothetical protein WS45_08430 [Burkholderia sp. RF2-non_BP3]